MSYSPLTTSTSASSVLADLAADAWFQAQHDVVTVTAAPVAHRGMLPAATRARRFPVAAAQEASAQRTRAASWA